MILKIRKFLFKGRSLFTPAAVIAILGFQAYWITDHFLDTRAELLDKAKTVFDKVVDQLNRDYIMGSVNRQSTLLPENLTLNSSSDTTLQIIIDTVYEYSFAEKSGLGEVPLIADNSYLYHLEKNLVWKIRHLGLQINFCREECDKKKNAVLITGEAPLLALKRVYSFEILALNSTVFLKIAPSIAISFFYVSLCLGALFTLRNSLERSRKLVMVKRTFTSNMTHELQTPLATLSTAIESLMKYNGRSDPELTEDYLNVMQREVNRLSALVDNILIRSQLDSEKFKLDKRKISVNTAILSTIQRFKDHLPINNARIEVSLPDEPVFVMGDLEHLSNAFGNLIENSIKYTSGNAQIEIRLTSDKKSVYVSHRDSGMGIPQKYRSLIFEPYFRINENFNLHPTKGHGLGLSYVKSIVDLHGGKISVESTPGVGTEFIIKLPLSK